MPGLELAARYRPARRGDVGGDWYDVFLLPSGSVAIAIGDVAGRGIAAATLMARLRNALRAYAMEFPSPSDVLDRLNRLLIHFDPDSMATLLFGIIDPADLRFRYASAGHIPPLFRSPDAHGSLHLMPSGPPLGVATDRPHLDTERALAPETLMILCTDGLIERRSESLDVGLRRLAEASSEDEPPESMADTILQRLLTEEEQDDDVALLVARTVPRPARTPKPTELEPLPARP